MKDLFKEKTDKSYVLVASARVNEKTGKPVYVNLDFKKRKKVATLILLLLFLVSPGAHAVDWSRIAHAIAKVESNHNPKAVNGKYVGYLQIAPIVVKDVNRILAMQGKAVHFTLNDRYSKQKSLRIFMVYQKFYNPKGSIEKAIRLWNGGPHYSVSKTQGYYKKVMKAFKGLRK